MKKMLIALLLLSFPAIAHEEIDFVFDDEPCSIKIAELLVREDAPKYDRVRQALSEFTTDPLINKLEQNHVLAVQSELRYSIAHQQMGPAETRTHFDLSWLTSYRFRSEFNEVVESFIGESAYQQMSAYQWLEMWENAFVAGGGSFSSAWVRGRKGHTPGRTRFLEALILEIGYRYQRFHGVADQPMLWSTDPKAKVFYARTLDNPIIASPEFQKKYDELHRKRLKIRTPAVKYPDQKKHIANRRAMEELGIPTRAYRNWKPSRKQWEATRIISEQEERVREAITEFGDSKVPLAGLYLFGSSSGESQPTFDWGFIMMIANERGGGLGYTMQKACREFPQLAHLKSGTRDWAREIVIQGAIVYKWETGADLQATDSEKPHYIDTSSSLWKLSGLGPKFMDTSVRTRLEQLGLSDKTEE